SRGALGILVEATVRVKPRPESARRLAYAFDTAGEAFGRAWRIRNEITEAASILVVQERGLPRARLEVVLAGLAPFVDAVRAEVDARCEGARARIAAACDPLGFRGEAAPAGACVVQIATAPARLFEAGAGIEELLAPADRITWDVIRGVRESWHSPDRSPFLD